MDVEKLCKVGKEMGLLGEPLRVWVEKQLADDEEKKQKEREDKEKEREDKEKEREDKEKEWARRQMEAELIQKEADTKRELIAQELELLRLRNESPNASNGASNRGTPGVGKSPKLPYFEDGKDQIDSYLIRFERYAEINKWSRNDWATHLSALLKGKALEAYCRLTVEESCDYDKVKETLLKRYNLTEEGFNVKFRNSRPEPGERMSNFRARISTYLDKWMEIAGKAKANAEEVRDLFIKEQLINACGPELATFLKERKPATSDAVATLAEQYIDAHGVQKAFSKPPAAMYKTGTDFKSQAPRVEQSSSPPSPTRNQGGPSKIVCRACMKTGHTEKECRSRPKQISAVQYGGPPECHYCGRKGHTIEGCWEKQRKEANNQGGGSEHQVAAVRSEVRGEMNGNRNENSECTGGIPVLSAAVYSVLPEKLDQTRLPIANGVLSGKTVKVLRDSGCTGVIVRRGLVDERAISNEHIPVKLANGSSIKAPLVRTHLTCPYFIGEVNAVVMDSPPFDVLLGNIKGAKCPGMDGCHSKIKAEGSGGVGVFACGATIGRSEVGGTNECEVGDGEANGLANKSNRPMGKDPLNAKSRRGRTSRTMWKKHKKRAFDTLNEALSSQPVEKAVKTIDDVVRIARAVCNDSKFAKKESVQDKKLTVFVLRGDVSQSGSMLEAPPVVVTCRDALLKYGDLYTYQ